MRTVNYKIESARIHRPLRIALLSDLHDRDGSKALELVQKASPDLIAVVGDLSQRLDLAEGTVTPHDKTVTHKNAFAFLTDCVKIAPAFYAFGNHEICSCRWELGDVNGETMKKHIAIIKETGTVLLRNEAVVHEELVIGGIESGYLYGDKVPDLSVIDQMEKMEGYRILLCHHPEYYPKYLKHRKIDLILSGHAHGGQIRLFGRGLYAPGQRLFPEYAGGKHDERLVVGRGLCNTVKIPRLFNPPEVAVVDVLPKK